MACYMVIIHDKRLPVEYQQALMEQLPEAELIPFTGPEKIKVYDSIAYHPDIYLFQIDEKSFVYSPDLPEEFLDTLREHGASLIPGRDAPDGKYPGTAGYNAVRVGDKVFLNEAHADTCVLDAVRRKGIRAINVKQGYARCSVLPISDKAIITTDSSIASSAEKVGVKSLIIEASGILLPGERYGFIGGASGVCPGGRIVILGDPGYHPEEKEIKNFLSRYALSDVITLPGIEVYDAGSLMIL